MTNDRNWRERPDAERAYGFEMAFCGDPTCGLHITAFRENSSVICEIVMSADQTLRMIGLCKDHLYAKTVERDDG